MKIIVKSMKRLPLVIVAATILFSGCGIGKMVKNAQTINYEAIPSPLVLEGDSVRISVNGTFIPKYFHKKATLTITPVVKYQGGEKKLKSITLKGEKLEGGDQRVNFKNGGQFTVKDKFLFVPGMEKSEVIIQAVAEYKGKQTSFQETKITEGTLITQLLAKNDYKVIFAKDKFDKNPTLTQKANIYFVVDQWDIRPIELKSDEMVNMTNFISKAIKSGSVFEKLDIYGYASPEGELKRNAKLSDNRADAANGVIMNLFKKAKYKIESGRSDFYNKYTTNYEDWEGLKGMLESSSVSGKDQALEIIRTIGDPEAREAEFRKIAAFDPIYETYFPKLRRAEINLVSKIKSRTDEEIKNMALSSPDSLGMEELMYAATLFKGKDDKLRIYQAFSRLYPEDFRGFNNTGCIFIENGKINEAFLEFDKAGRISPNNQIVQNNLGVASVLKGDKKAGLNYLNSAGSGTEVSYNKGNIALSAGKYPEAVSNYGDACSFNAALAKLLAGNRSGAIQTLDCSSDKESPESFYLRAVTDARNDNKQGVISNLKKAIEGKGQMKTKAANDLEFRKLFSDSEFTGLVK